jgi:hypothetical protein
MSELNSHMTQRLVVASRSLYYVLLTPIQLRDCLFELSGS